MVRGETFDYNHLKSFTYNILTYKDKKHIFQLTIDNG